MGSHPLHLHSMVVHAVIALALLGAAAFVARAAGAGSEAWSLLLWLSVVGVAVLTVPATLTGVLERGRMYASWHPSHRAKLVLSVALLGLAVLEVVGLLRGDGPLRLASPLGLGVVVGSPALALMLSFYGLRITLGRQGWGRTSYVPDMHRDPPNDILAKVAEHAAEDPKLIDVLEEHS